jgi:hypothetical protein
MDLKIVIGVVAGILLLGVIYFEESLESGGEYRLPAEAAEGPEALAWLRKNDNESALASNRFLETSNAIRFVQELYRAGAERVVVPADSITDDGVEVYADALVVTLPSDPQKRQRVWKLCAREIERSGEDPGDGTEEKHVFLWWD